MLGPQQTLVVSKTLASSHSHDSHTDLNLTSSNRSFAPTTIHRPSTSTPPSHPAPRPAGRTADRLSKPRRRGAGRGSGTRSPPARLSIPPSRGP